MVLGEAESYKLWPKQKVNTLKARNHQGGMCLEIQYSNK
jgi:hypothetical protein